MQTMQWEKAEDDCKKALDLDRKNVKVTVCYFFHPCFRVRKYQPLNLPCLSFGGYQLRELNYFFLVPNEFQQRNFDKVDESEAVIMKTIKAITQVISVAMLQYMFKNKNSNIIHLGGLHHKLLNLCYAHKFLFFDSLNYTVFMVP